MAVLTDFHCHSNISKDGKLSMLDMAWAEYKAGVRILCFTDHCDTVHWRTLKFSPRCEEIAPELKNTYEKIQTELPEDLDLRIGIELGEMYFHPEHAEKFWKTPYLDFVLGSLHILPVCGDVWGLSYDTKEKREKYKELYLDKLIEVAENGWYDVLAHIGYIRRPMCFYGYDDGINLKDNGEKIEYILKTAINQGKGIEINCSGIREGCGPFPSLEILRLYRNLGGEIITVGSDAHTAQHAGKCLNDGYEVLKEAGFRYFTTFKKHKPDFNLL